MYHSAANSLGCARTYVVMSHERPARFFADETSALLDVVVDHERPARFFADGTSALLAFRPST